jgi:hypothetical protein
MKTNEKIMLDFLKKKGGKRKPLKLSSGQISQQIVYEREKIVRVITEKYTWNPSRIACNNTLNALANKGFITLDYSDKFNPTILVNK